MERGKYIRTPAIRLKNSEAQRGKPSSFKGKRHTVEARAKQRQAAILRERRPHYPETKEKMRVIRLGEKSHWWKGGFTHDGEGRIDENRSGVRKRRARYTVEDSLGRSLLSREVVHHINENKGDDRVENLYLFRNQASHNRWHKYLRRHQLIGSILKSNVPFNN